MAKAPTYHLSIFAFDFRESAELCRDRAQEAAKAKSFALEDWAIISKAAGGKVSISSSKSANPGGMRGGVFGGGAGMVLAVISGPIGAGAVLGGAAIGAVTAGLVDSGFPAARLKEMSTLMRDDRSLLLLAVPNEDAAALDAFIASEVAFNAVDGRYDVDINPETTLADAMHDYRLDEEDA